MNTEFDDSAVMKRVKLSWGEDAPDWVQGLARECAKTSQNKVAKRLGYSAATVSFVLGNRYTGDMKRFEEVYRGVFEAAVVACPELGEVKMDECHKWQGRALSFAGTNSRRVHMYRACRRCPLFLNRQERKERTDEDT